MIYIFIYQRVFLCLSSGSIYDTASCIQQETFSIFCTLGDGCVPSLFECFSTTRRCPLTAASQLRDGRRTSTWKQALLSLNRSAWLLSMLPVDAVISFQHQTTFILYHMHAIRLQPPVTYFTCRFAPFPSLQGLEVLMASWMWTYPFSLCNEIFWWSAVLTVLPPPFTPVVHLSWPCKLGR